jgi:hypothetical protein
VKPPDPHAIWLSRQVIQTDAQSPSGQARRAAEAERQERWADLAVGQQVWLSSAALQQLQGHGVPLRLDPATPCRVLRVDVERDCALIAVTVEQPHGCSGSVANECGREAILLQLPTTEEPPPPPPTPNYRPSPLPPRRGTRDTRRSYPVW